MLELAIEEGIDPYDMLYRLVNHPSGAMRSLYHRRTGPTVFLPTRASAISNCSRS